MAKARPRFANGRVYSPSGANERVIADAWLLHGKPRVEGWFGADMVFVFRYPKKQAHAYPPKKDVDNLSKLVLDALNGLAYDDDSRCVTMSCRKQYGPVPLTRVRLYPL